MKMLSELARTSWIRRRLFAVADRKSTGSMRRRHVRVPRRANTRDHSAAERELVKEVEEGAGSFLSGAWKDQSAVSWT